MPRRTRMVKMMLNHCVTHKSTKISGQKPLLPTQKFESSIDFHHELQSHWFSWRFLSRTQPRKCSVSCIISTAQKMKFSIQDFFNKCAQIRSFLRNWSLLLRKSFFVQWSRLLSFLSLFFEPNSIILIISSPISMLSLLSTKRSQTFEKLSLSFSSISFESHYW